MHLYSTNNPGVRVTFQEALFKGLPADKGLYMPSALPVLPEDFIQRLEKYSFQEIAFRIAEHLLMGEIPGNALEAIIEQAVSFPAPLVELDSNTFILELFHGPSMAFKDFGARFMAQTMAYFNKETDRDLYILVATSGDTGGAVAAGFHNTPGIHVVILYPSGKVSPLQEKQLTTLGGNVAALEVMGTFDDCQALVKQAFLDEDLNTAMRLSSANSINIARLIPQSFYYFEAWKELPHYDLPVVFSVPSGNFGSLTAGLMAKKMGLPVSRFLAATNANKVVPEYLETGKYNPRPSVRTISNAMDVGAPSNFARMQDLYSSTWNAMRADIAGFSFSDEQTRDAMQALEKKNGYMLDPHGAVGFLAFREYQKHVEPVQGIILETAHPAKFREDVSQIFGHEIDLPLRLLELTDKQKISVVIPPVYSAVKDWLMEYSKGR
ncbi:MAG: threonine synthase [Lewinellaceae bacterium]|nr:threonine synthase [Lewinellaceae bacterium]